MPANDERDYVLVSEHMKRRQTAPQNEWPAHRFLARRKSRTTKIHHLLAAVWDTVFSFLLQIRMMLVAGDRRIGYK